MFFLVIFSPWSLLAFTFDSGLPISSISAILCVWPLFLYFTVITTFNMNGSPCSLTLLLWYYIWWINWVPPFLMINCQTSTGKGLILLRFSWSTTMLGRKDGLEELIWEFLRERGKVLGRCLLIHGSHFSFKTIINLNFKIKSSHSST
jgi:hypothetical protein